MQVNYFFLFAILSQTLGEPLRGIQLASVDGLSQSIDENADYTGTGNSPKPQPIKYRSITNGESNFNDPGHLGIRTMAAGIQRRNRETRLIRPGIPPMFRPKPQPIRRPRPPPVLRPRPAIKPLPKPPVRPQPKPLPKPVFRPKPQPIHRPKPLPVLRPSPVIKPLPKPPVRPQPKPLPKPVLRPKPQPIHRPKPLPVLRPKPVIKPLPKPQPKLSERPQLKPQPKPQIPPQPKPQLKPPPKPQPKPHPKSQPKPQPDPQPNIQPKPLPQPQLKPQPLPIQNNPSTNSAKVNHDNQKEVVAKADVSRTPGQPPTVSGEVSVKTPGNHEIGAKAKVQPGVGGQGSVYGKVNMLDGPKHNLDVNIQHDRPFGKDLKPGPGTNSLKVNYENQNGVGANVGVSHTNGKPRQPISVTGGASVKTPGNNEIGANVNIKPGIGGEGSVHGKVNILDGPKHNLDVSVQHDRPLSKDVKPAGPGTNSINLNYGNEKGVEANIGVSRTQGKPVEGKVGVSFPIVSKPDVNIKFGAEATKEQGKKPDYQIGIQGEIKLP